MEELLGDDAKVLRDGIHGASTQYHDSLLWDHTQVCSIHQSVYMTAPVELETNMHHASALYVGPACGNPLTQVLALTPCLGAIAGGLHCRLHHVTYVPASWPSVLFLHDPGVTLQHVNIAPLLQAVIPKGVRVVHVPDSILTEKGTDSLGCALGHRLSGPN